MFHWVVLRAPVPTSSPQTHQLLLTITSARFLRSLQNTVRTTASFQNAQHRSTAKSRPQSRLRRTKQQAHELPPAIRSSRSSLPKRSQASKRTRSRRRRIRWLWPCASPGCQSRDEAGGHIWRFLLPRQSAIYTEHEHGVSGPSRLVAPCSADK